MKWKRRGMVFMMNDFKAYLRYYVNSKIGRASCRERV